MPDIEVVNLTKVFDSVVAVDNVSFKISGREYVALLGPSGCGKTTLLKMIAGHYAPTSGQIFIDKKPVNEIPPEDRNIGFFFQNYALFPHLTVEENVSYGPIMRGIGTNNVEKIVDDVLKTVKLSQWKDYLPRYLSGGMQQRVALARTLALGSKIILLDEPLNALDAKIGAMLRYELVKISKKMGLTVIHVTPDQEEAMEVADKIIVMKKGRIVQFDTDYNIYNHPSTPFVAHFIGESNFIIAKRVSNFSAKFNNTIINIDREIKTENIVLAIRPEKILFEKKKQNNLEGVIENINFFGETKRFEINVHNTIISVRTSKYSGLKVGDRVFIHLPPEHIMIFENPEKLYDELKIE